jgi:hypothetical protein
MVASVLGGIISLDEGRLGKEPSGANTLILYHQDGLFSIPMGRKRALARSVVTRHDINMTMMRSRTLVFAFFAASMLFSVVREWSAPSACPRLPMTAKVRLR